MITFYYNLAPNPMKVALFLEETGLPSELKPVDTRKGEQHKPEFVAINPNAKVPVIIDQETGARVFDSNAILLYLAEHRVDGRPSIAGYDGALWAPFLPLDIDAHPPRSTLGDALTLATFGQTGSVFAPPALT